MLSHRKKIVSIGAGYVGGPTMAVMAYKIPDIDVFILRMIVRCGRYQFSANPAMEGKVISFL